MLGLALFLVSLGVLFAAALVGFLVIRLRAGTWLPPGVSGLPAGLWLSTLLLAACSVGVQRAVADIRGGHAQRLTRDLGLTLAAACGFIAVQGAVWVVFRAGVELRAHGLYAFTFYMLTGLHAAHAVGGVVALAWVLARARRGAYTWAHYCGVRYCAIYWHFLAGVWIVLFAALKLAS